jgi:hypothetical protein
MASVYCDATLHAEVQITDTILGHIKLVAVQSIP